MLRQLQWTCPVSFGPH